MLPAGRLWWLVFLVIRVAPPFSPGCMPTAYLKAPVSSIELVGDSRIFLRKRTLSLTNPACYKEDLVLAFPSDGLTPPIVVYLSRVLVEQVKRVSRELGSSAAPSLDQVRIIDT